MERDVRDKVLSDVHVFTPHHTHTKGHKTVAVTRFYFSWSHHDLTVDSCVDPSNVHNSQSDTAVYDEDGDLEVVRRCSNADNHVITLEHTMETTLDDVGLQVWQGCLLLCDYVLHLHTKFKDSTVLDLGSGVGLTSIVAGLFAKSVLVTDVGEDVLCVAERNIATNKPLLGGRSNFYVRQLDWCQPLSCSGSPENKYCLTKADMDILDQVTYILAAEVIYDPNLTEAFFQTVKWVMCRPPVKTLFIALERRMVFTVEDMDVVSPAYDHFRKQLDKLAASEDVTYTIRQIPCDFPKFFKYDRHKQLELWEVSSSMPG